MLLAVLLLAHHTTDPAGYTAPAPAPSPAHSCQWCLTSNP
jgi:hypothetical protein